MVDGPELALQLAGVTVRDGDGKFKVLRELLTVADEQEYLREAIGHRWPVWIETRLDGPASELYEEPVKPWGELNRPAVHANDLDPLLDCLDGDRALIKRLLEMLPRLDDYGAARLAAEVAGDTYNRSEFLVLPLMGFVPLRIDGDRLVLAIDQSIADLANPLERFRCAELRLSLAVVRNLVLTARLPDRVCPPPPRGETCGVIVGGPTVRVRTRHLPQTGSKLTALDMATAIARYLTGTCTAVVRDIQDRLTAVEREVLADDEAADKEFDASAALRQIHRLGELADHMSRELSRGMRRMPEDDDPGQADAEAKLVVQRTVARVKDALEELRHLQTELSFAGSTMTNLVSVRQLRAAESQRDSSEAFQQGLSKVGAVVLLPTLIAAVWGANTWLPGEKNQLGFAALVLLMFGGAGAVWELMETYWHRRTAARSGEPARKRARSRFWRFAYPVSVIAFFAGLVLMVGVGATTKTTDESSTNAAQQ
jgi:CorA-like Mg2+ transporter protein